MSHSANRNRNVLGSLFSPGSPSFVRKSNPAAETSSVDLQKLLADRESRRKQNEALAKLKESPTMVSSQELLQISTSGDNTTDFSHESSSKNLDATLASVNIFHPKYVFHIFQKGDVQFSWLNPSCNIPDLPKSVTSDEMISYIETTVQMLCLRRSMNNTCCRFLLYLMSVHDDLDVAESCYEIVSMQASNSLMPFSFQIPDLLVILMNYGTLQGCLWPMEQTLEYPVPFKGDQFTSFKTGSSGHQFPIENLKMVLKVLLCHMKAYSGYTEEEKEGLFFLLLNLAMASEVSCDWSCLIIIKDLLTTILMSYTDEEWCEMSYKKVEDLALMCWHKELEPVGIVQRIELIPRSTLRGIQLQRAAAFFAIQHLLDFNPISLYGIVSFAEILQLLEHRKIVECPTDYEVIYSVVMLLTFSIDVDDPSEVDREKLERFKAYIAEWRHSIRDSTADLDQRPLIIKDLMTQLEVIWCKLAPVDRVV